MKRKRIYNPFKKAKKTKFNRVMLSKTASGILKGCDKLSVGENKTRHGMDILYIDKSHSQLICEELYMRSVDVTVIKISDIDHDKFLKLIKSNTNCLILNIKRLIDAPSNKYNPHGDLIESNIKRLEIINILRYNGSLFSWENITFNCLEHLTCHFLSIQTLQNFKDNAFTNLKTLELTFMKGDKRSNLSILNKMINLEELTLHGKHWLDTDCVVSNKRLKLIKLVNNNLKNLSIVTEGSLNSIVIENSFISIDSISIKNVVYGVVPKNKIDLTVLLKNCTFRFNTIWGLSNFLDAELPSVNTSDYNIINIFEKKTMTTMQMNINYTNPIISGEEMRIHFIKNIILGGLSVTKVPISAHDLWNNSLKKIIVPNFNLIK